MPTCPRCGAAVASGASYCGNCGQRLGTFLGNLPPPEATLTVVPRVTLRDWKGERECSLLITNLRSIFVVEGMDNYRGFLVGGVLGAALAGRPQKFDYRGTPPAAFASDPVNVVIPHGAVRRFLARGGLDEMKVQLEWLDQSGKQTALKVGFSPPAEMFSKKRFLGRNRAAAVSEYGRGIMEDYRRALPPDVFQRTTWQV